MSDLRNFEKWLDTVDNMPTPATLSWSEFARQDLLSNPESPHDMTRQKFQNMMTTILDENEKKYISVNGWRGL